jgi:hypothetical protein
VDFMDRALTNAENKIAECDKEISEKIITISMLNDDIARIKEERERVVQFVATWYEMMGIPNPSSVHTVISGGKSDLESRITRPKNPGRESVANAVIEFIRQIGRPVSRTEAHEALIARGIHLQGKDPEMILSTMLWRSKDRIVRLPGFGYWPAKYAHPSSGYNPVFDDLIGVAADEPEEAIEAEDHD